MNSPVSVNQGQSNLPLRGVAPPDTTQKHTPRKGHSMKALVKARREKGLWMQDLVQDDRYVAKRTGCFAGNH